MSNLTVYFFIKIAYDPEHSKESIYVVMDFIGKQGEKHVRKFWNCVNQEHICGLYHEIYDLIQTLKHGKKTFLSPSLSQLGSQLLFFFFIADVFQSLDCHLI